MFVNHYLKTKMLIELLGSAIATQNIDKSLLSLVQDGPVPENAEHYTVKFGRTDVLNTLEIDNAFDSSVVSFVNTRQLAQQIVHGVDAERIKPLEEIFTSREKRNKRLTLYDALHIMQKDIADTAAIITEVLNPFGEQVYY